MNLSPEDKIVKAKVNLQKINPFFSYLVMNLQFQRVDDDSSIEIPTIGVDRGGRCYYNPKFIEQLSQEELEGVLVHEVLHIILEHLGRVRGRDLNLSNICQDIVVNNLVLENRLRLPQCGFIPRDDRITLKVEPNKAIEITEISKKVWEEIYDIVVKEMKNQENKLKNVEQQLDTHIHQSEGDDGSSDSSSKANQEHKWRKLVAEAYTYSKMQGKTPLGLERYIEELLEPKIPWKQLLQKYIQTLIPSDYTFSRPSKKSIHLGIFLPAIQKQYLEVVVGVDTSGSIRKEELQRFISEVVGMVSQYENTKIILIECDSKIHEIVSLNSTSDIQGLQLRGGGGTDFRPVFRYVQQNIPNCPVVIYLTDGWGTYPEEEVVKTIWVLTDKSKTPPFGQVIYIDRQDLKE